MKNYIKLIFIYLLLSGNVYAFCDFDNFKIGFATTSNEDLITSDTDDFSYLGNHGFEKIDGEQICNDNAYHDLTFDGEYIQNNLVAVSLYEANTPINHLENILCNQAVHILQIVLQNTHLILSYWARNKILHTPI